MGGLLILVVATVAFLAVSKYTVPALTVLFVTLGCGAIGFLDDFIKLHAPPLARAARPLEDAAARADHGRRRLRGRSPAAAARASSSRSCTGTSSSSWGWYVLLFLVIAGTANGVNLTDGARRARGGNGIIALLTFTAIAVVTYIRSGNPAGASTAASISRSSAPR